MAPIVGLNWRRYIAPPLGILLFFGSITIGFNYVVFDSIPGPLYEPMSPSPGVGSLSATRCRSCHPTIYEEWSQSNHAKATRDPLYRADLALQGEPYFCDHCHAPLVEQRATITEGLWAPWPKLLTRSRPNPRHDPMLHSEGVTCVACHQSGMKMVGPHPVEQAPHPVLVSDALRSPTRCEPCHVLDLGVLGDLERPLADTLEEWREYRRKGGDQSCVDCHMPRAAPRSLVPGGLKRQSTSHRLRGVFDAEFVRKGIGILDPTLSFSPQGAAQASLTLENRSGHRIPTAEPHRYIELRLDALDSAGHSLGNKRLVLERKVDLHALEELPGQDTTLQPRERREIRLEIDAPLPTTTHTARLRLRFFIWNPEDPIAKASKLGLEALSHTLLDIRQARAPLSGPAPSP